MGQSKPDLQLEDLRVAVVHEWLVIYAGAEKVLEQILHVFPRADVFTLVDFLPAEDRGFLAGRKITTSFLQKIPGIRKRYRHFLPLMPFAVEQFDLSKYDLVISSSHAVAKGVITGPDQPHITYCHSPIRYAWDLQHEYLRESGMDSGVLSWVVRYLLHKIRMWDVRTGYGVDRFLANSHFIQRRVRKVYRRDATVVYPPVAVKECKPAMRDGVTLPREDFYLAASRMVPYKRMAAIAEAFQYLPGRKLVMVGEGPEMAKVREVAGPNVELLGWQSTETLRDLMGRARAFIFAAEEDFGITPVEAQAAGAPVIAFGRGGARETVIDGRTGVFFNEQTPEAIADAVLRFEEVEGSFDVETIRRNAERFSEERFRDEFRRVVLETFLSFDAPIGENGPGCSCGRRLSAVA